MLHLMQYRPVYWDPTGVIPWSSAGAGYLFLVCGIPRVAVGGERGRSRLGQPGRWLGRRGRGQMIDIELLAAPVAD